MWPAAGWGLCLPMPCGGQSGAVMPTQKGWDCGAVLAPPRLWLGEGRPPAAAPVAMQPERWPLTYTAIFEVGAYTANAFE